MNKATLLTSIRTFRQQVMSELDRLEDALMSIEVPEQDVKAQVVPTSDDWLTVKQVCSELHISNSTFYQWLNEGRLPPGVEFGPQSKRWKMSEIREWQETGRDHQDAEERQNTHKRRGRISRVRKIKEFCYV